VTELFKWNFGKVRDSKRSKSSSQERLVNLSSVSVIGVVIHSNDTLELRSKVALDLLNVQLRHEPCLLLASAMENGRGRIRTYDQGIHLSPTFPPGVDYLFIDARVVRTNADHGCGTLLPVIKGTGALR